MIISNATPLIAFTRIGELKLLAKLVGGIVIPDAVAREISEYGPEKAGYIDISKESWIKVQSIKSEQQVLLLLPTLDRGEAEVIVLAMENEAELVLLDELTGRNVAESLGLSITGSVGLLIHAKQIGEIRLIRPLIEKMINHGIRYSQRFVEHVLRNVGEKNN